MTEAKMWRPDEVGKVFDRQACSQDLHRYAGRVHALSCIPKRSSIDKRYFAEVNRYHGDGLMHYNVAMGTGADPVIAALNGYATAVADPVWSAFRLEHEAGLLRTAVNKARETERWIDKALDTLADLLKTVPRPIRVHANHDPFGNRYDDTYGE